MHVLGHSFSQRRKPSKPRDLPIRKVSFSGCSLSSGSSLSSSSSSSSSAASTPLSCRISSSFDPLSLHPTFQPPPRLHDRPLLSPEGRLYEPATFDDDESDGGYFSGAGMYGYEGKEELPPLTIPMMDDDTGHDWTEPQDYFLQITKRPQLPRSRWSESTVHTLEELTPAASITSTADDGLDGDDCLDDDDDCGYSFQQPNHQSMPNFSYKRTTAVPKRTMTLPKRPPLTLDNLEEFIKRGGWKRRGIVFHEEDMGGDEGFF
ncbi:Uncharacterized protein TCAP_02581 [Tolypocladium capitatum]|uniref:Uncharacterized protein n=1 Tax=Tolypocladium capitatum TaxID=45235 RepID=A0A2K3QIZ4_9HYPO|nr:Uncharacterized protein TCAP_02581 [Tolypocladium capitatum]